MTSELENKVLELESKISIYEIAINGLESRLKNLEARFPEEKKDVNSRDYFRGMKS